MNKLPFFKHAKHLLGASMATALPIACSGSALMLAYRHQHELLSASNGEIGLLYAGLCLAMAFALLPTTLVATLGGFFWGWKALLFAIPSYMLAAWIAYKSAQRLGSETIWESIQKHPKAKAIAQRMHSHPLQATIYAKLSPALPFALSNLLLAWAKLPLGTFLLGSLLGMMPRTALSTWAGASLQQISEATNLQGPWILALLFVFSVVGLYKILSPSLRS